MSDTNRIRRKVPIGTETACRNCGRRFISSYQAGRYSRGEFCSRRCALSARRKGKKLAAYHVACLRFGFRRWVRRKNQSLAELAALGQDASRSEKSDFQIMAVESTR